MALTKEEQELVLKVTGQQDVAKLTDLLDMELRTIQHLNDARRAGAITEAAYEAQLKRSAAGAVANQAAIDATRASTRGYQQNITALGYALNDFFSVQGSLQQRLNGIANNMPMLLAGFGQWGLALSAILPIIGMLLPQLGKLAEAMGFKALEEGLTRFEKLKTIIQELEAKEIKLAVDVSELATARKELEALQKAAAAFKAAGETKNQFEKASGEQVKGILQEESGPDGEKATRDAVKNSLAKQFADANPEIKKAQDEAAKADRDAESADGQINPLTGEIDTITAPRLRRQAEASREKARKLRQAAEASAETKTGEMFGGAKAGDVNQQQALARQLRGVGKGDLADSIEANAPEALKAFDEDEAAFEHANDKWREFRQTLAEKRAKVIQKALHEVGKDVGEKALQRLVDHADRGKVTTDVQDQLKDQLKTQMAKAGVNPKHLDDFAKGAAKEVLKPLTPTHVRDVRQQRQQHAQADEKKVDDEAAKQAEQNQKDTEKGLGDDFLAQAEADRIALARAQMKPKARAEAMRKLQAWQQEAARRRLMANGVEPGRAEELSNGLGGFLNQDINRQLNEMHANAQSQGISANRNQLADALQQQLRANAAANAAQAQAQAQGDQRRRDGGGMRSVAPTAPGANQAQPGAQQPVQLPLPSPNALFQANQALQAENAQMRAWITEVVRTQQSQAREIRANMQAQQYDAYNTMVSPYN